LMMRRPTRGKLRWANRPADPSRGRVNAREGELAEIAGEVSEHGLAGSLGCDRLSCIRRATLV
jgi:hypothetical protein